MKGKKHKKKSLRRMLTLALCLALCIADIIPTSMTVWASEVTDESAEENSSEVMTDLEEDAVSEEEGDDDAVEAPDLPEGAGGEGPENPGLTEGTEGEETETPDPAEGSEGEKTETPDPAEGTEGGETETTAPAEGDEGADGDVSADQPENPGGEETEPGAEGEETEVPDETIPGQDEAGETVSENTVELEDSLISTLAAAEGVIASGSYTENGSNTTWVIDKNWKLTVEGTGEVCSAGTYWGRSMPWAEHVESIKTAEINVIGMTDASYLFYRCRNLTKIDLKNFDTSTVTNMRQMFYECRKLGNLDLAGFKTSNVTDMVAMFGDCRGLKSLDVSGFDTSKVTDMQAMFSECMALTNLDLGSFDTSKVTDMDSMFAECSALTNLNLSGFDTSNVTHMSMMFFECQALTNLDISGFTTSKVTDMNYMFSGCSELGSLDLSQFDTSAVTDMSGMFDSCGALKSLNLSNFDTSKVTDMSNMFMSCNELQSLDLSSFDTSRVENMSEMFRMTRMNLDLSGFNTSNVTNMYCMFAQNHGRTELDVSSFDTSKVVTMNGMFNSSKDLAVLDLSNFDLSSVDDEMTSFLPNWKGGKLQTIYTPKKLKQTVPLKYVWNGVSTPETWYYADGETTQELPQNLDYSVILTKTKPTAAITSSISASKKKKAYLCGEKVNVDDITVTYRSSNGIVTRVTDFTTDADQIDMSAPGKKTLTITYKEPETDKVLTAEIELTVTLLIGSENAKVTLPAEASYVYNGDPQKPLPTVTLTSGNRELEREKDYTVSYVNNVNAGTAQVKVQGMGDYSGTISADFTIEKAPVTIKALDTTIAVGDAVPETFDYETTGFYNRDERNVTDVSFSFKDENGTDVAKENIDTTKTGTYEIVPGNAKVGTNYTVAENGYQSGTLMIAEERIMYTVFFDMKGHKAPDFMTQRISVKAGSRLSNPLDAYRDEKSIFTGWYKDSACTKEWNFSVDTVQENITLYARWIAAEQMPKGGICIQEIPEQTYTGSAIKPAVAVYESYGDSVGPLKSGKDYTIKYYNNTAADTKDAVGGTYNSLEGAQNGFDKDLPYVMITGKGNHKGTVYSNFHIKPVSIADGSGNPAAGFTLKYTDQLVTNVKKEQKPFSSLKYKKAMKAGTDYTVTLEAVEVHYYDGDNKVDVSAWSKTGDADEKWIPAIPKGYEGTFRMTVSGKGNYSGTISRTVYVDAKANLLKNVGVSLGKNQKSMEYNGGQEVELTPGYFANKKYYTVSEAGVISGEPEANANGLFTVKAGKSYLVCGKDYRISYSGNRAVGTATMTLTGIGDYKGSKSVTFKITGKAFKANTIEVKAYNQSSPNENDFKASVPYTGKPVTQNKVTLTKKATNADPKTETLLYGKHYTISYKNNIKKGSATMTFTAKPESGYTGKFNKTFKIGAVQISDASAVKVVNGQTEDTLQSTKDEKGNLIYSLPGAVAYAKEGAKPSGQISLKLSDGVTGGNLTLKEGTDYTVSYANNKAVTAGTTVAANKMPTMTFKGKGNYTGSFKVTFTISAAAMENEGDSLAVSAAALALNANKADDYAYQPKITVKDGKKALSVNKDYTVTYQNCTQKAVSDYLAALKDANTTWDAAQQKRPKAVIRAAEGSGYSTGTGKEIIQYLDIYETKLTSGNLYVVVSDKAEETTYKGLQVTPGVTVYYGEASAVKAAKKDKVTAEDKLTAANGSYKLTKLSERKEAAGDYTLAYAANVTAGKNKGSLTVTGAGVYGGSVTVKFTILQRDVYGAP